MSRPAVHVLPSRVRIACFTLGVLLTVGLILGGYAYHELTAEIEAAGLEAPNNLDARELDRKVKLLDQALAGSRRGFVRLSEVEINSYLHQHSPPPGSDTNAPPAGDGCRLVRCCADLVPGGVIFYDWVQVTWHGHTCTLCWQRSAEARPVGDRWASALTAMRVGQQSIPPSLWAKVSQFFHAADEPFSKQYAWLARLPAVDIQLSELDQAPELRLYTFHDPGLWRQVKR